MVNTQYQPTTLLSGSLISSLIACQRWCYGIVQYQPTTFDMIRRLSDTEIQSCGRTCGLVHRLAKITKTSTTNG